MLLSQYLSRLVISNSIGSSSIYVYIYSLESLGAIGVDIAGLTQDGDFVSWDGGGAGGGDDGSENNDEFHFEFFVCFCGLVTVFREAEAWTDNHLAGSDSFYTQKISEEYLENDKWNDNQ